MMDEPCEMSKEEIMPTLRVSAKNLPEVKNWKVDETYKVVVEMQMSGINKYGDDYEATFKIKSIKDLGKKDKGYSKNLSDFS